MNRVQFHGPQHPNSVTCSMEDALCLQKQIDDLRESLASAIDLLKAIRPYIDELAKLAKSKGAQIE